MSDTPTIIYTKTDEAPALATHSLLPIVRAFTRKAGIEVVLKDISLAGRILSQFPNHLNEGQQVEDALTQLGEQTQDPKVNIIKLPNISASLPQMLDTIEELQQQGYKLPDYPINPKDDEEHSIKARYDKAKGSAVNPVLREGNSDRRAPKAVKTYAKNNPHSMGEWSADSKSHVSSMEKGDFFGNERSQILDAEKEKVVDIILVHKSGKEKVLKDNISINAGTIVDASFMNVKMLRRFFQDQIFYAQREDILLSVHLKATMMKVSDPIIFGHMVELFYADVLNEHSEFLQEIGFNPNNGIADLYNKLDELPSSHQNIKNQIEAKIQEIYKKQPDLAMVDSDKGITNLHVPNNVIIDASMPAALRTSGRMWNAQGKTQDTKFIIPDRSYAGIYQEVIDFCKENGAFDVTTMGSVSNVGLMAKKAEEYGSHDKTFEIPHSGTIVVREPGKNRNWFRHNVQKGDIWRMCTVERSAVRDWVKLAVRRGRVVGSVVFWLDRNRSHDSRLIGKVREYLKQYETEGVEILILAPKDAMRYTLERVKAGLDTVSATGNVLRDYLTDLFPILELGTSAKMLSIVPLMKGGGLFETGAGGSAPKHVQQFTKENHLRWDSLGEFLALGVSLEHVSKVHRHPQAQILADTLDAATTQLLQNGKSPKRKVHELDNRGSHFYLALYWAQALAAQEDAALANVFAPLAQALSAKETEIVAQLNAVQGKAMDIGGYYNPDDALCAQAMRPSETFNSIIDSF